jgi:GMP synthase-like glutamine amidotransferase
MNICILENDIVDPDMAAHYAGYGVMFENLFQSIGIKWTFESFKTCTNHFPSCYDHFDAVLLTGSRADAFSNEAWIVTLRQQVTALIECKMPLLGICFGHQLIAHCLGAQVGRAPQGWGIGCMQYNWHSEHVPFIQDTRQLISLLASHQDQVFGLPSQATLLASSPFCPVAAYSVQNHIFCVQAHPEFDTNYCTYLLNKRRPHMTEADYTSSLTSLQHAHDGAFIARAMANFLEYKT